jgi:MFS family permease
MSADRHCVLAGASTVDSRWILTAQAGRAFGYGLAAVLLGTTLAAAGRSASQVGLILAAVLAGTVMASMAVGMLADRLGRRRSYLALYLALAGTGVVFASTGRWPLLAGVGLLGMLSTEVVESGPFTTLEQAMLATSTPDERPLVRGLGRYNAVAAAAGSLGALAATAPNLVRRVLPGAPGEQRYFLTLTAVALLGGYAATRLSPAGEADPPAVHQNPAPRMVPVVWRLAGLFAVDSFGGGFAVQAFVVYWLQHRYGASTTLTAVVMFAVGLLQTASFLTAPAIAHRIGLLPTMVATHLPSNLLLAGLAVAPTLPAAIGLLLAAPHCPKWTYPPARRT